MISKTTSPPRRSGGPALLLRLVLCRWSFLAAQLSVTLLPASVAYLVYVAIMAAFDPLGPIAWIGSAVLTLLEAFALALGLSYGFETWACSVDVKFRGRPRHGGCLRGGAGRHR